jgi:hypothetical protein
VWVLKLHEEVLFSGIYDESHKCYNLPLHQEAHRRMDPVDITLKGEFQIILGLTPLVRKKIQ